MNNLLSTEQRTEMVWRERAQRLSKPAILGEAGQDVVPVLVLGIGNELYGIDLPDVGEVLPPIQTTPVPGKSVVFAGVINVHGEIRPVIDLRRLLAVEKGQNDCPARVILLRKTGREVGLQIDSVEQIRWIAPGDLQLMGDGSPGCSPKIRGSTKDLLMLLSTDALFAELDTGVET